jgi:deoxyribodipyrimidine photolyase-like uncharacterized protein
LFHISTIFSLFSSLRAFAHNILSNGFKVVFIGIQSITSLLGLSVYLSSNLANLVGVALSLSSIIHSIS